MFERKTIKTNILHRRVLATVHVDQRSHLGGLEKGFSGDECPCAVGEIVPAECVEGVGEDGEGGGRQRERRWGEGGG